MEELEILVLDNYTKKLQVKVEEKWYDIIEIRKGTITYRINNDKKVYEASEFKELLEDLNYKTIYLYEIKEEDIRISKITHTKGMIK